MTFVCDPGAFGAMMRSKHLSFAEVGREVVSRAFGVTTSGFDTPDPKQLHWLYVKGEYFTLLNFAERI